MNCFKVITSSFLIIMHSALVAMEKKQVSTLERKTSKPLNIMQQSLSQKPSENSPSQYAVHIPSLSDCVTVVSNSFGSLRSTATNYLWDDSAFQKLGWPLEDGIAQQELEKSKEIYRRVNQYIQTQTMYDTFLEDYEAISRRYSYCQRVLKALPTISKRSEALELATFCLKHHSQVMNDFDKSSFLLFVTTEKEKSKQEVKRANLELKELTIVHPDDNELLKNLFEQTVSKYPKKIEKNDPKKDGKK